MTTHPGDDRRRRPGRAEAAWQLARRGVAWTCTRCGRQEDARPPDRRPRELVCSNSLRGNALDQAAGLLKEEMRRMGSLIIRVADEVKVPAGSALAVDRELFARKVTEAVAALPRGRAPPRRGRAHPGGPLVIVATGPLTSEALAADIARFVGEDHLYFYDAVSPVVEADSIDFERAFRASRYGRGGDDYVNCPLTEEDYRAFHEAVMTAERATVHDFEHEKFFEAACPWR
jgi:methylenetetrahydrofolate--tRNA-(uracil-5-)-methyltransferase